jgi:hypothetical protein
MLCASAFAGTIVDPVTITKDKVKTDVRIDYLPRRFTGETTWHFSCNPDFEYEKLASKPNEAKLKIKTASLKIGLDMVQVLPAKRTKKLEQHEAGHETIAKQIFAGAEKSARQSCKAAIGQTFTGSGKNEKEAVDNAIDAASHFVCDKYAESTGKYCDAVSAWYDSITDHGFKPIVEKKAIEQAFKKTGPPK